MSRDRRDPRYFEDPNRDPRYNNAGYMNPHPSELMRAADPLSNDESDDPANPGLSFGYSPVQGMTLNPYNAAGPVYGTPALPGQITTFQYVVTDKTHDGFFKLAVSTGPFLVGIRVGQRQIFSVAAGPAGYPPNAVHSALVFGVNAGNPGLWLRALHTRTNDIVYFDCYDISGAVNYVYILIDGVQK